MIPLLSIEPGSDLAIYAQIAEGIKRAYAQGRLREGDLLPPVRQMAEDLGVDPNTVVRAYRVLAGEGFLELVRGRGSTVVCSRGTVSYTHLTLPTN